MTQESNVTENIMANFHDIITPDPISMFPVSDGYVVLLLLLAAALFPLSLYAYKYYTRNIYRKEALNEIKQIKSADMPPDKELTSTLQLLKRVAIVAYSREEVASLSGKQWWQFLKAKSHITPDDHLDAYCESIYLSNRVLTYEKNDTVIKYAKKWIKKHQGAKID